MTERSPVPNRRPILTERILQILRMSAVGLEDTEIAFVLGVSVSTVKTHMKIALRALDAVNRPEAIHLCHQRGLFHEKEAA